MPLLRGSLINRYINYWNKNSWIDYGEWLAAPRDFAIFKEKEKIIVRQTGDRIIAMLIGANIICRNNLHIIISYRLEPKFILGILNSKLTNFYYFQINPERGEALAEVKKNHVEQLPIPKTTSNSQKKEIVKMVDQILILNEEIISTTLQSKINQLQSRIDFCEQRINEIVYKLYGLNEDEIKLVEESSK